MVVGKIGVKIEEAAAAGLMQSAAFHARIGNQASYAGQLRKPGDKAGRVEFVGHAAQAGRKKLPLGHAEFVLIVVFVLDPGLGVGRWKLLRNRASQASVEKVPKEDVGQWTIFCVLPG